MKLVKLSIELIIDNEDITSPTINKDVISGYLNHKLYYDPEFFGDFGPENIMEVIELE
jgi:hypothetical protein